MKANRAAFRDAFNLYEKHLAHIAGPEFSWDVLCNEITAVALSHENDPLAMDLLVAVHAELERKWMERNIPTHS